MALLCAPDVLRCIEIWPTVSKQYPLPNSNKKKLMLLRVTAKTPGCTWQAGTRACINYQALVTKIPRELESLWILSIRNWDGLTQASSHNKLNKSFTKLLQYKWLQFKQLQLKQPCPNHLALHNHLVWTQDKTNQLQYNQSQLFSQFNQSSQCNQSQLITILIFSLAVLKPPRQLLQLLLDSPNQHQSHSSNQNNSLLIHNQPMDQTKHLVAAKPLTLDMAKTHSHKGSNQPSIQTQSPNQPMLNSTLVNSSHLLILSQELLKPIWLDCLETWCSKPPICHKIQWMHQSPSLK